MAYNTAQGAQSSVYAVGKEGEALRRRGTVVELDDEVVPPRGRPGMIGGGHETPPSSREGERARGREGEGFGRGQT